VAPGRTPGLLFLLLETPSILDGRDFLRAEHRAGAGGGARCRPAASSTVAGRSVSDKLQRVRAQLTTIWTWAWEVMTLSRVDPGLSSGLAFFSSAIVASLRFIGEQVVLIL
jgi:hypothetical protein